MAVAEKPSLRFFYSPALRKRADVLLSRIEKDDDATQHAEALSRVVSDLTAEGFAYYFLRPLEEARFGFVARQTAKLGVASAMRFMSPMISRILGGADTPQLRGVAKHIRGLTGAAVPGRRRPTRAGS
jgi:hypothetical protein